MSKYFDPYCSSGAIKISRTHPKVKNKNYVKKGTKPTAEQRGLKPLRLGRVKDELLGGKK
jgi:hypothetical protein